MSTRSTPFLASASLRTRGLPPVSTRRVLGPSRTTMASPWPTSRTMTSLPPVSPMLAKARATESTTPPNAAGLRLLGNGHAHQIAHRSATVPPTTRTFRCIGTTAHGRRATACATPATPWARRPARASTGPPSPTLSKTRPTRPAASATEVNGTATGLLTTPSTGNWPKSAAVSGSVDTWAVRHTATGATSAPAQRGVIARTHSSARRPKRTIPRTAETESMRPAENAAVASKQSMRATQQESAATESLRRPPNMASIPAATSPRARTAEG